MPGDTARMALGPRAPEAAVEALREEMHLNDSYIVQYGYWISGGYCRVISRFHSDKKTCCGGYKLLSAGHP